MATNTLVLDRAPSGAQMFTDAAETARKSAIKLVIAQCPACGLVQSTSPPVPYYRTAITAAGLSSSMRTHRVRQATAFRNAFGLQGRNVVEVGCHSAYFLEILTDLGMRSVGTQWEDLSRGTRPDIVRTYPGHGGSIRGGPFAAFFCLNFLEHSPAPREFLQGIGNNLTKGGVGLIEVPNYGNQRSSQRVFDYVADHLCYFDTQTLTQVLSLSGFSVVSVVETRDGENLEAWVRLRETVDFSSEDSAIAQAQQSLVHWLSLQLRDQRRVAAWGASHQALTLLARTDASMLVGIFDSAPFKQHRYAPASGLVILEPTPAALSAVDVILITAAGYEQEIAFNLRQTLAFSGEIYKISGVKIQAL